MAASAAQSGGFRAWRRRALVAVALGTTIVACATSPLGRKQLIAVPDGYMNQLGAQSFAQVEQQTPADPSPPLAAYVHCVVDPITAAAADRVQVEHWDVVVFKSDQVNAFALPGGKIGVYTGIFKVAQNDAQLATVLGHEVGHVLAKHGAERVTDQLVVQGGLMAVEQVFRDGATAKIAMSALGLGAQYGILLPFSRTQESEADLIGLDLMAQAGFDPHESLRLWQNMVQMEGGKAPSEFLSDHPSSPNRIENLQAHLDSAVQRYQAAQAAGRHPRCTRPPGY